MAHLSQRATWLLTFGVLAGTFGYAVKRFMDPHDPPGIPVLNTPRAGSEWVGKRFEPFKLRASGGQSVNSADHLGKRPVVVLFHGGRDSPFSMIQASHMGSLKQLQAARAVVYVVTMDDPDVVARLVKRNWSRLGLPEERTDFFFVGDDYGEFSRKYVGEPTRALPNQPGVLNRGTFVVGKDREVLFAFVNVTPKLHPPLNQILEAVERAGRDIP